VDLCFCESPVRQHYRYLDRVCTSEEARRVRNSPDPAKSLAVIWAAKEAAYKLLSKRLALEHFVPKRYVAQSENQAGQGIGNSLLIVYGRTQSEVAIFVEEKWVHAVASSPGMEVRWKVCEIAGCSLEGRRASNESEAVRFLAKSLLEEIALIDVILQFDGRIPQLRSRSRSGSGSGSGSAVNLDVSLAHHGAFAAAAISVPAGRSWSQDRESASFKTTPSSEAVCSTFTA